MLKVGIDIDDVIVRFFPAMCEKSGRKCERIDIWDGYGEAEFVRLNFPKIERNKMFWLNLKPLSYPVDLNFEFDYYITSSPGIMRTIRQDWLTMNGYPNKPVIATDDKLATMRRLGVDVLIDDKIVTLEAVKRAGLIPIQFIPPYMSIEREDLNPIRHLSQVNEILNNINI